MEESIFDVYAQYCTEFIELILQLESMWDSHLDQIILAQKGIELQPRGTWPIFNLAFQSGPKWGDLKSDEISKLFELGVISPDQTEGTSPNLLAPKVWCMIRLCDEYKKLCTVTLSDSYPFHGMDSCID